MRCGGGIRARLLAVLLLVAGHEPAGAARMDAEAVRAAADYSARHGETALLVWQRGKILLEREASHPEGPPRIFSITKSLVALGVIKDIAAGRLGAHDGLRVVRHPGVTIAHLLNQTSGLPPAQAEFYSRGFRDKRRVLDGLTPSGEPGRRFRYGASNWEVLAEELRSRRKEPLEEWLDRVLPPLEMEDLARWRRDETGVPFFSTGARLHARRLLELGREVLRGLEPRGRGAWPAEIREAFRTGTAANRMYALGFWINGAAAEESSREVEVEENIGLPREPQFWQSACLAKSAPPDLVAMIGTRGQRVFVAPSRGLIAVRQGVGRGWSDARFLNALFGGDQ